ncbi:simple sugar transport system permease protein [Kineococcus xinjiangensis]|uniref:Simple sugar transport system permease protein n=1 Tax=Kineococcus xinjiangensis TaxID=512762 RepID=A0A2S6IKA0_9ACTN|nr:ABC transporter permease [Kineococcus xinjiangensis]PPK94605.1 simple sugar transport system permease protein [Kineococcus xinjiangensis]
MSTSTPLGKLRTNGLLWPIVALVALLVVNVIARPSFASITLRDGHLYGSLIDILRNGAPTLLVALGMTLVIATRGIDLSVGATAAIVGAITTTYIVAAPDPASARAAFIGMAIALVACALLGVWNGFLVSVLGIQPIIATLVLMVAGRGIAMLITDGQIITVNNEAFSVVGAGFVLLPVSILISIAVFIGLVIITRRTALGMLIESVGINPEASRLAGIRSRTIVWMVYVFAALCAGVAGLMITSNVNSVNPNSVGLWIELDAILAVVIGGTSLAGGRFSLAGTLLGALVIQTLTTTVYNLGIEPQAILVFKAAVVLAVCLMQAPKFRARFVRRPKPPTPAIRPTAPAPVPSKVGQ